MLDVNCIDRMFKTSFKNSKIPFPKLFSLLEMHISCSVYILQHYIMFSLTNLSLDLLLDQIKM